MTQEKPKDEESKKDTEKQSKNQDKIKQMPVDDALDHFSSDPEQGLSEDEAKKRLEKYGKNKIEEEKKSPILKFLSYFWGPIPFMLESAIILGAVVQRWEEFGVMLTMLLINVGVSFWHDREAENAIAALKEKLAPAPGAMGFPCSNIHCRLKARIEVLKRVLACCSTFSQNEEKNPVTPTSKFQLSGSISWRMQ